MENYIRASLKRAGIRQKDAAALLTTCPSTFAKVIAGARPPTLDLALGLEAIFGLPVARMFPALRERVQDRVIGVCGRMEKQLEDREDPEADRLRRLFAEIMDRAETTPLA